MPAFILVVDDSNDALELAERYLALKGLDVVTSTRTDTVTSLLLRRPPDVIVLDVMMPRMSGSALALVIRNLVPKTPIVFYSAVHEEQGRSLIKEHVRARFVSKTHGVMALHRAVMDALRERAPAARL